MSWGSKKTNHAYETSGERSRTVALEAGDVILTGTPNGVGVFRDPQVFLEPGGRVDVEVGDFGVLSNPVGDYLWVGAERSATAPLRDRGEERNGR